MRMMMMTKNFIERELLHKDKGKKLVSLIGTRNFFSSASDAVNVNRPWYIFYYNKSHRFAFYNSCERLFPRHLPPLRCPDDIVASFDEIDGVMLDEGPPTNSPSSHAAIQIPPDIKAMCEEAEKRVREKPEYLINTQPSLFNGTIDLEAVKQRYMSNTLDLDEALGCFNSLIGKQPVPIEIYYYLIATFSDKGQYATVVDKYKQLMASAYFQPHLGTIKVVMNCLCYDLNRVDLGLSLLAAVLKLGISLDYQTYVPLISCHCREGRVQEATSLIQKMILQGTEPEGLYICFLLSEMYHSGKWEYAKRFFSCLVEIGFVPDILVYNQLISYHCSQGSSQEAHILFRKMKDEGIAPNVETYRTLIRDFCKLGKLKDATRLVYCMIDSGFSPSLSTYNSLIMCLCKDDRKVEAFCLFKMMIWNEIKPDVHTVTPLLSAFCESDINTFIGLYNSLCNRGKESEALKALEEMIYKGQVEGIAVVTAKAETEVSTPSNLEIFNADNVF